MIASLIGNLTLSLLRTVFYLVAKRPTAALDEAAAAFGVAGRPLKLARARRLRARGRRAAYSALRGDLPPGRSLRRAAEFAASVLSRPAPKTWPARTTPPMTPTTTSRCSPTAGSSSAR